MKSKKTKKRREGFDFSGQFRKSLEYIKESKKFIYLIIGIFFFFVLFGYFVPAPQAVHDKIMDFIKQVLEETKDMQQQELIKFIISNNIKSTFSGIFLGIIFGIFPIASAVANGYLLGFVSLISVNSGGILTLWKILPHGIFELPAVFISLGLGLKFGTFLFKKRKLKTFKNYLVNSLRTFLLVVVPLLIIAGIIEGTLMFLIK